MRTTLAIALILGAIGCASDELPPTERERVFARAGSYGSRVHEAVRRIRTAQEKLAEYLVLADELEADLATRRRELQRLRAANDRRAREVASLNAEAAQIETELAALKTRLEEARKKKADAAARIDALMLELFPPPKGDKEK